MDTELETVIGIIVDNAVSYVCFKSYNCEKWVDFSSHSGPSAAAPNFTPPSIYRLLSAAAKISSWHPENG